MDDEGKWRVTVTNLANGETFYDEGDVLINATGFLKYVASADVNLTKKCKSLLLIVLKRLGSAESRWAIQLQGCSCTFSQLS